MLQVIATRKIFIQNESGRTVVNSLTPYLHKSLELGNFMQENMIREEDRRNCSWIGFGLAKGATSTDTTATAITVLSTYSESFPMLHGQLINGFAGVGDPLDCYLCDDDSSPRFGSFVRWTYFASPYDGPDFLAVDFEPGGSAKGGKATNQQQVALLASRCMEHGIPGSAELILANPRMIENEAHRLIRSLAGLHSVADWARLQATASEPGWAAINPPSK